jgi:hypothetical protein
LFNDFFTYYTLISNVNFEEEEEEKRAPEERRKKK